LKFKQGKLAFLKDIVAIISSTKLIINIKMERINPNILRQLAVPFCVVLIEPEEPQHLTNIENIKQMKLNTSIIINIYKLDE
jgi:hypothetical protein